MATEDYNVGWADATGNGWNPVDRRGAELEHYSKGFTDGCNRAKPHRLIPLDDLTVTGPDPSRAEMAMHIMAGMLACPIVTGSADEIAKSSVEYADALQAALARKEKP
jgi:hypothetical protein